MTAAPFEIIRIALQDLAADATADQALVAHYQAAGVNAAPVMVQRHDDLTYTVVEGHQTVVAMQAAGLTWCWCLVVGAGAYQQERALVAAAEAAPAPHAPAPEAAPQASEAAPEAAPAPQAAKPARKPARKAGQAKAPTLKELRAQAKAQGLRGYSKLSKAQLLALLA